MILRRFFDIRNCCKAAALIGLAATIAGCASGPGKVKENTATADPVEPLNKPAGVSQSARVRAGVLPLGLVPYDNLTLPIASPDGQFIASENGVAPTPAVMRAETGATVPQETHIEIYKVDFRQDLKSAVRTQPELTTTLSEPAVLGRSCDAEGFLIESPRSDGSRWIGKASWETGEIKWLVSGEQVNAFAAMGADGRLAWSRRDKDAGHLELVVRHGSDEWTLPSQGDDWLLPTWTDSGSALFVFRLNEGKLDIQFGSAGSPTAFRQSMRKLPLIDNGTVDIAYQAVALNVNVVGSKPAPTDQLIFFHPNYVYRRAFLWRPLAITKRSETYLNAGSFTALIDDSDYALISTNANLVHQNLWQPNERISLVVGMQVARPTTSGQWPYLLLSPDDGRVGLIAMRLLPLSAAAAAEPREAPPPADASKPQP